jgi:dolichyl-phosphate beta-glucosyltransferase
MKDNASSPHAKSTFAYDLSVIVPAYNEEGRIGRTLEAINGYFLGKPLTREILVVDDGSSDNTVRVVEDLRARIEGLSCISYHLNRGKGYAVRRGVEASLGEYILFTDADNSTPIEEFEKFYPLLKDHEVVIGSRYVAGSNVVIRQPKSRILVGRLANVLIRLLLAEGFKDTQCGFKAFQHRAGRDLFHRMTIDRFGFDIELISIARLLGFSVKEVPITWYDSPETRLRPIRDTFRTLTDLIRIKANLCRGRYG